MKMTENQEEIFESIMRKIAEQFGAKYTLWYSQNKYKQSKKIVIEYDSKGKGTDL